MLVTTSALVCAIGVCVVPAQEAGLDSLLDREHAPAEPVSSDEPEPGDQDIRSPATREEEAPREKREEDAAAESRRSGVIEEIIVTAQKREESLREVPISMTVLDSEFLAEQSITDLREASAYIPNVSLDVDGFFLRPRMRGFSATNNEGFEQPIGLIIDGVPYGRGPYFQSALFDLDRIEVLRGPQGTLFGKNTSIGLLNLIPKNPTDEPEGHLDLQIGERGRRRAEAAVGGPLVPGIVNVRVAGLRDERDGLVRNTTKATVPEANESFLGRDRKAVRGRLQFPDLLGVDAVVSFERLDLELTGGGAELRIVPEDVRPFFLQHDPNTDFRPQNRIGSIDSPERQLRTINTFVTNASTQIGAWGVDLVVGWSSLVEDDLVDGDFSPIPIAFVDSLRDSDQVTFEIRLSSPDLGGLLGFERLFGAALGSSDFTVGFFYQTRKFDDFLHLTTNEAVIAEFIVFQNEPISAGLLPPGTIGMVDQEQGESEVDSLFLQDQRAIAGFGQMNWHFLPRWTMIAGGRVSTESKEGFWDQQISDNSVLIAAIFDEFTGRQSRSELEFSPKLGMRYDWTDDVNVFATWARSFRSGGFNATLVKEDPESREVDAEKVTSWELGSKTRLLGGAAQLNVGLFWTNLTDFQLVTEEPTFILDAPVVVNVGEIRSRGVEVDGLWLPTDWLTLVGALGFNDTEFLEFPFGICEEDRQNTDGDEEGRCDLSGKPLERAPTWSITLTPRVRWPLARALGPLVEPLSAFRDVDLTASLTAEYQDAQFLRETLDPRSRQGSFFRVDTDVGLANEGQGWSLGFVVENLTDVRTASLVEDVAVSTGTFAHFVEPQRLFFGRFRWSF